MRSSICCYIELLFLFIFDLISKFHQFVIFKKHPNGLQLLNNWVSCFSACFFRCSSFWRDLLHLRNSFLAELHSTVSVGMWERRLAQPWDLDGGRCHAESKDDDHLDQLREDWVSYKYIWSKASVSSESLTRWISISRWLNLVYIIWSCMYIYMQVFIAAPFVYLNGGPWW